MGVIIKKDKVIGGCYYHYRFGDISLSQSYRVGNRARVLETEENLKQQIEGEWKIQEKIMEEKQEQETSRNLLSDNDCKYDMDSHSCVPGGCYYHYQFGDISLNQSCRVGK